MPAPKLEAARVIKDYIPETNAHLTLELDTIVYVNMATANKEMVEGEVLGIYGVFPKSHIKFCKDEK